MRERLQQWLDTTSEASKRHIAIGILAAVVAVGVAWLGSWVAMRGYMLVRREHEFLVSMAARIGKVEDRLDKVEYQITQSNTVAEHTRRASLRAQINSQRILEAVTLGSFTRQPIVLGENDTYAGLDHNFGGSNDTSTRSEVSCGSVMRKGTAVILVAGQSNAANHGQGPLLAPEGVYNFNFFDGKCYVGQEPLLGNTGKGAGFPTRLAKRLIAAGAYEHVLLVPIAVAGTAINEWVPGGRFFRRFEVAIEHLRRRKIAITHMLWHQGEGDYIPAANGDAYQRDFTSIFAALRNAGMYAPIYVAQATTCGKKPVSEIIRAAQRSVVNQARDIRAGPDTDQIGFDMRYDDCHLNSAGLDLHAQLWADILTADLPR